MSEVVSSTGEEFSTVARAEAIVVQDIPVSLWRDGETIVVSSRVVASLQRDGWLLESPDQIPPLLDEIKLLAAQVASNIENLVNTVIAANQWDPHDGAIYEASLTSRRMLDEKISSLLGIIHAAYPVIQGTPLMATHPATNESFSHDPNQVPMIDPEGNARAVDPAQVDHLSTLGWSKI